MRTAIIAAVLTLAVTGTASAHLIGKPKSNTLKATIAYQKANLAHVRGAVRALERAIHERAQGDVVARSLSHEGRERLRWHRQWIKILGRELRRSEAALEARSKPAVDACLSDLIMRESRWNVTATNPTTGAYGLPQALPGSKMASAGADWRTNPDTQIRWMVAYVNARYGGSCSALAFQIANGYY